MIWCVESVKNEMSKKLHLSFYCKLGKRDTMLIIQILISGKSGPMFAGNDTNVKHKINFYNF